MAKSGKLKPGPVKREVVPVLLRVEPGLAKWFASEAKRAGVSRSKLIEGVMGAVMGAVAWAERFPEAPVDLVGDVVGAELVEALVELGMGTEKMRVWREWVRDERFRAGVERRVEGKGR